MKASKRAGTRGGMTLLGQEDMEILVYMTSDIWITPEIKRFKHEILNRLQKD